MALGVGTLFAGVGMLKADEMGLLLPFTFWGSNYCGYGPLSAMFVSEERTLPLLEKPLFVGIMLVLLLKF